MRLDRFIERALWVACVGALLLCSPVVSLGQNVINPGHVEYTVSPDHASLSKYVLGFFLPGATDPVQSQDLPIVAPDGTGKVTQPINATPLTFGTYVARLRSFAGAVGGEWSQPSNAFDRAPLPTPAPLVRK